MPDADQLFEIFHRAVNCQSLTERVRLVDETCRGDQELKSQVLRLLKNHEEAGDFLQKGFRPRAEVVTEKPGEMVGGYKLLEVLGEGGCGIVYVAEQTEPFQRMVALKVIKIGMDTKAAIARFQAERQALALMEHPNIAKALDAGTTASGRPYFVMELVRGMAIAKYCEQNRLSTSERLELFVKVCGAIQHAHQKGIIHRDIKPSNILVNSADGSPVPRVIDFGIAKAIEGRLSDATVYTQLMQFIGTPAYMSPEQAEVGALDIDTRTDIYSLGVLLYELITGSTPFDGQKLIASGIDAMRKTICETEPIRPSAKIRQLQIQNDAVTSKNTFRTKSAANTNDLDLIVMKCLAKDRSQRYDTANDLAADVIRYLKNEPIVARAPSAIYKFRKAWLRNKIAFTATGAVAATLLIGGSFATWQAIRASKSEQAATLAETRARRSAYVAEMNVAFRALAESNLEKARELLDRQRPKQNETDLRGFEWRYLWEVCRGDEFATFTKEGADAATAFSPDGKTLAYSGEKIIVRDRKSLALITNLPSRADTLSFAPHTNLLATASDSDVTLWDTQTWRKIDALTNAIAPALFSPNGQWLLTGAPGGFQLWNTAVWRPVNVSHDAPALMWQMRNAVAFSPNSQFLLTFSGKGLDLADRLRVWRLPSLEEEREIKFEVDSPSFEDDRAAVGTSPASAAFTTDGKNVIIGLWDGRVIVLDFSTREIRATLRRHTVNVTAIAISPDGETFVTGCVDQSLNLWDARTFKHLAQFRGNIGRIWAVAISPDAETVMCNTLEGVTRLWRMDKRHAPMVLPGSGGFAGFFADGKSLFTGSSNGWRAWTPSNGNITNISVVTNESFASWGKPFDVRAADSLGAIGRSNGKIEIWDLAKELKIKEWEAHQNEISAVTFSRNGNLLATGTTNGIVKVWTPHGTQTAAHFRPVDCHFGCLAFSPDSQILAGSGVSSSVWLWNVNTGGELRTLDGHKTLVGQVAFSPDGRLLATTSFSGDVRLWELPFGTELPPLKGHVLSTCAAAFSNDGKTLATGDMGAKVKLWNVLTRQELTTIQTANWFSMLSFSPTDGMLVSSERPANVARIQAILAPTFEEIAAATTNSAQSASSK